MTKQVQRRRGTDTQHTSFTGAEGEISVNTTNKSVHVHDGATAGGFEAARADLGNVSDADLNSALTGNTLSSLTVTSADINGGSIDGTSINTSTIDGTVIGGTTPAAGSFTTGSFTGNVSFGDNDKAIFGAGSDLQIYHDGSASFISDVGNGALHVRGTNLILQNSDGTKRFLDGNDGGAVEIHYADATNGIKLATTSTGIDVTGTVTADGLTVEGSGTSTFSGGQYLQVDGDAAGFTDAEPVLWARSKVGASIMQINVEGDQWAFGNGGTLDTTPAMRIDGGSHDITFYDTSGNASFVYDESAGSTFNEQGDNKDFRVESDGQTHMLAVDASANELFVKTTGTFGGVLNVGGLLVGGTGSATNGGALIASRYNGASGLGSGDFLGVITNEKSSGAFGLAYGLYGDSVAQGYLSSYDNFSGGRGIVEVGESNIRIKNQRVSAATAVGTSVTLQELAKFTQTKSHFNDDGVDLDFIIETDGHANAFNVNASEDHISFFGTSNAAMDGVQGIQIGDTSSLSAGIGMATANHSFLMYIDNSSDLFSLYDSTNNADRMQLLNDGTFVFNQTGAANADFRVESNNNAYALFVDSNAQSVSIGTSNASGVAGDGLRVQSNAVGSASAAALSLGGTGGDFYPMIFYNNATDYVTFYAVSSGSTNYVDTIFTDAGQSITDTNRHRLYSTGTVEYTPADGGEFVWNQGSADADFRVETDDRVYGLHVDGGSDYVGIGGQQNGATALYVQGGISQSSSQYDPVLSSNITLESPMTAAAGGSIEAVYGMLGTSRAGSQFIIEYAAHSWKSFVFEIEFASTRGFVKAVVGGYNNAGLTSNYVLDDPSSMVTSVAAATTSTTTANQGVKVTLTMNAADVHPMFRVKYTQSGGDSVPRGDRLYFKFDY